MLQKKNISLSRLRKLIFGKGSGKNKRDKKTNEASESKPAVDDDTDETRESSADELPDAANEPDKNSLPDSESLMT